MTATGIASIVHEHFARSVAASDRFFDREARSVAECCRQMADRFVKGGRLLVVGEGAQASDAQHVAVEFVHPVIVGKRALPAIALTSDIGVFTASAQRAADQAFAGPLDVLARPLDILLAICASETEPSIRAAIRTAREKGLLTVLVSGRTTALDRVADIEFQIDISDPFIAQEVAETLYHVIWELVHVFVAANDDAAMAFLVGPKHATAEDLLNEVQSSTRQKAQDVSALRVALLRECGSQVLEAGRAMAGRISSGGKVLAFGNGGSATDAQDAASDCVAPPVAVWQRIPALALTNDVGVVTAIGNDVGFEHVFSRQIIAFAQPGDIALGFSTSGASRNVNAAFTEAKARGLLTIAMSGGDGGPVSRSESIDFCFTAPSEHLPRIQEAHSTAWHALLATVQETLR